MSISLRKLGILAAVAMVFLLFATVRPGIDTPTAEADLGAPGGISALPSAAPGFPGIANQGIPAIIPATEPGRGASNHAVVSVFCDQVGVLPFATTPCSEGGGFIDGFGAITFEMEQVYGDGSLASSFAASGSDTLVCTDNAACDLTDASMLFGAPVPGAIGVVAVDVVGGGENEILQITATDEVGEARTVTVVVVDTILAWGATGAVSTASQESPAFISYACDDTGQRALGALDIAAEQLAPLVWDGAGPGDGRAGVDDIFDLIYGVGFGLAILTNNFAGDVDIPLLQCGGDTGGLFDDFVDFQTDLGMFSVDPMGATIQQSIAGLAMIGVLTPPSLDFDCGEGKNIDTYDINALGVWGALFVTGNFTEGGCDADFAENGVVTTALLGTGEVGVATITAQQGGGVSPPRTINVTFVGEAALSLFIDAPAAIGLTGSDFDVMVVDQDGRPVGNETVECTVDPAGGALAIVNQTGTTGAITSDNPGEVTFTLVPTGASVVGGEEITVTCVLDRDRSVSASAAISLSGTPDLESVDLVMGCNPVASTWPDGTAATAVGDNVAPAEALDAVWKFDPGSGAWQGYSPAAPQASDLASVDMLDAIFICVNASATWARPVI